MKQLLNTLLAIILIFTMVQPVLSAGDNAPVQAPKLIRFTQFPIGESQILEFRANDDTFGRMTQREQLDQLRDWILFTVVSDAGLTVQEMNQVLYDVPAVRYGYMRPIANFEHGTTRSVVIAEQQVLALVPAAVTPLKRQDLLAHIADEHRKDLGEVPTDIHVFEYVINQKEQLGVVTRYDSFPAQLLFKREVGYYEAKIQTLDDLQAFIDQIDDITFGQFQAGHLLLGGRKIHSREYRSIRVEDIAAIWQAEQKIHAELDRFDAKWDRAVTEFNEYWSEQTYRTATEKHRLELQRDQEWQELMTQAAMEQRTLSLVNGSGFSLDPAYDFEGLLSYFHSIKSDLKEFTIAATLPALISDQDIQDAEDGLIRHDIDPYFRLFAKLNNSPDPLTVVFAEDLFDRGSSYRFQAARYDGDLKGTEVGMVLFYTDLLAKLWALNYQNNTPHQTIEDFYSMTQSSLSPIYERELEELGHTRLWFGPQNKGFQVANAGDSILFARNAARIYAASANQYSPGVESEPNAQSEAFLGWWNNHYEEVAEYEPEYERLNEIMKWSLLISWLNEANRGDSIDFLQAVKVKRDNWFPEWVKMHPELAFQHWNTVQFYPKGYKGTQTEALPRLVSERYSLFGSSERRLQGGVSLAPKELFEGRKALRSDVSPFVRRSNLAYDDIRSGGRVLRTQDNIQYNLKPISSSKASVVSTPKQSAKLRAPFSEVTNLKFERIVEQRGPNLDMYTSAGSQELGRLNIQHTQNGFKIGWASRDMDLGQSLARQLSTSSDPLKTLVANPNVKTVLDGGDNLYFVKVDGSEKWLKLASDDGTSVSIPHGWQSRVANDSDDAGQFLLAWVDDADVTKNLRQQEYIVLELLEENGTGVLKNSPRGPPSGSDAVEIQYADEAIPVHIDSATGKIYARTQDLPVELRQRPQDLPPILSRSPGLLDVEHFKQQLASQDYSELAKQTVNAPDKMQELMELYWADRLRFSQQLAKEGKYAYALQEIDKLLEIYDSEPELLIRKALIQHDQGSRYQVALTLDKIDMEKLTNLEPDLLNEINERLASERLTFVLGQDNPVELHKQVDNLVGNAVAPDEVAEQISKGDATLYVQDNPALSNLDWSGSSEEISQTLYQTITDDLGVAIRLSDEDAALFKPTVIHTEDGVRARAAKHSNVAGTVAAATLAGALAAATLDGCPDDDESCEDFGGSNIEAASVYVLVTNN